MSDYPNLRDCKHGSMRGKCDVCEYEQDISELELKLGIAETEIGILKEENAKQAGKITELERVLKKFEHAVRNENELLEMEENQLKRDRVVVSKLNSYLIKRANEENETLPLSLVDHIAEFKGQLEKTQGGKNESKPL
jgi:hypothetical protein